MRHKGIKKEETRAKIEDASSRCFRKYGYSGIGVDGLAKSAGVTSGAFYSHLGSKGAAFENALTAGLDEVIDTIPELQEKYGAAWVRNFCEYYLSKAHRSDFECGCAMASLTSEVVRANENIKMVFEGKMNHIVYLIAQGLDGEDDENRVERAWAMLSILIGGLNLARAMNSALAAKKISQALIETAIQAVIKSE